MASAPVDNSWKVDRHFDYESVNFYYTNKIKAFPTPDIHNLPNESFASLMELGTHLRNIVGVLGLTMPKCDVSNMYLWSQFLEETSPEKRYNAWKFREYVFGCAMLFLAQYVPNVQRTDATRGQPSIQILDTANPRIIPPAYEMKDHSFTIVGSSELTSDIDITIQGPHASFLISVIEDLFLYLTTNEGIPMRCWDVEFYGDFKLLPSLFVNFSKFNNPQRLLLLKYALASYFRSTHHESAAQVHPNVQFLVKHCLKLLSTPKMEIDSMYNQVVENALAITPKVLDREAFYKDLMFIESDSKLIKYFKNMEGVIVSDNTNLAKKGQDLGNFGFNLFYALARANLNRAESYVLPSTAVQVVEFEQKKVGKSTLGLPETWFSSNARIGIDKFGYLLSAIEQLGYLEHYHPRETECSKKGIKYFGRYVRALIQAGLLPEKSAFTSAYIDLNAYRSKKEANAICGYNVHELLEGILSFVTVNANQGSRLTRKNGARNVTRNLAQKAPLRRTNGARNLGVMARATRRLRR